MNSISRIKTRDDLMLSLLDRLRQSLPRGLRYIPFNIGVDRALGYRDLVYVELKWSPDEWDAIAMEVPDMIVEIDPFEELARLIVEAFYVRRG